MSCWAGSLEALVGLQLQPQARQAMRVSRGSSPLAFICSEHETFRKQRLPASTMLMWGF